MKILVCGGRDYSNVAYLYRQMDILDCLHGIDCVVHGCARGADTLAGKWAKATGKDIKEYPADWNTNGSSAGPRRNALMLKQERPDLVVAFPGGRGTLDMINKAKARKIRVIEV